MCWTFLPFFSEFIDSSFVLQRMFTPPIICNDVVSRIVLKNLQTLLCKDCAVVSWHAELVQCPNKLGIFLQRSREKAQSGDPNGYLLNMFATRQGERWQ